MVPGYRANSLEAQKKHRGEPILPGRSKATLPTSGVGTATG